MACLCGHHRPFLISVQNCGLIIPVSFPTGCLVADEAVRHEGDDAKPSRIVREMTPPRQRARYHQQLFEALSQGFALEALHGDEELAVGGLVDLVDGADVGMVEGRGGARLLHGLPEMLRLGGQFPDPHQRDDPAVAHQPEIRRLVQHEADGRRDEVVLATKVYGTMGDGPNEQGVSRYHIIKAAEDSLRRLQTDRIDLYQLHRPGLDVPQDETLRAFDDLIKAGKVRYIGCSTHPAWKVMEALAISEKMGLNRYISEQPPYNLLDRRVENEILPMCQAYDIGVLAWAPLAHGVLTGKYTQAQDLPEGSRGTLRNVFRERITEEGIAVGRRFAERADTKGCTAAQLAVAWVLHQPGITSTIIGPRNLEQLESLLPGADAWKELLQLVESSGADYVLWPHSRGQGQQKLRELVATGRWRPVYSDAVSWLLARTATVPQSEWLPSSPGPWRDLARLFNHSLERNAALITGNLKR